MQIKEDCSKWDLRWFKEASLFRNSSMNDYADFYLFNGAYYGALNMEQNYSSCDFSVLTSAVFFMGKKFG